MNITDRVQALHRHRYQLADIGVILATPAFVVIGGIVKLPACELPSPTELSRRNKHPNHRLARIGPLAAGSDAASAHDRTGSMRPRRSYAAVDPGAVAMLEITRLSTQRSPLRRYALSQYVPRVSPRPGC